MIPKYIEKKLEPLPIELYTWALDQLQDFSVCINKQKTDNETHYSHSFKLLMDAWFEYTHNKLGEFGFVNCEPEMNTWERNPKAKFWWVIYGINTHHYRPYYSHHASSNERLLQINNVLNDIVAWLKNIINISKKERFQNEK